MSEKFLVTAALPYANGPIHFGHIAGAYLPADIFTRYKKIKGEDIIFVCGTDEHGVAITISAEKEGRTPKEHVDKYYEVIKNIFDRFDIQFDNFSRTSLKHHYELSQDFFTSLIKQEYIKPKVTKQLFCTHDDMFLADRYITGTCPVCGFENARGDECGSCGSWIEAINIIKPKCKVCGNTPEVRETKHWFLQLQDLSPKLEQWLDEKPYWKDNVLKFVKSMIKEGLHERPITRDMKWGVPVPLDDAEGKVLYVWFDAPIGYISSTIEWAEKQGNPDLWKEYWFDKERKLIHFIGKDNIPFHCIVWPSMLIGQEKDYVLPHDVPSNEFYNLEGKQFSKSDGWYIDINDFLDRYPIDSIRYVIATNMPENKDSEFLWKDFQNRNNGELADTLGNFINRAFTFSFKYFDGKVPKFENPNDIDNAMLERIKSTPSKVGKHLDKFEVRKGLYEAMDLARAGNKYIDEKAPWKTRKSDQTDCANTIFVSLQIVKCLAGIFYPFIPSTSEKIWGYLGFNSPIKDYRWDDFGKKLLETGQSLNKADILFTKIDDKTIEKEIEKMKTDFEKAKAIKDKTFIKEIKPEIEYEDFAKLDLRVAKILEAEKVKKSKKLIKLQIDLGNEKRQIVAGIGEVYKAEELIGKQITVIANLKPAKIMGVESNGMLLAVHNPDGLQLLTTESKSEPGASIS